MSKIDEILMSEYQFSFFSPEQLTKTKQALLDHLKAQPELEINLSTFINGHGRRSCGRCGLEIYACSCSGAIEAIENVIAMLERELGATP